MKLKVQSVISLNLTIGGVLLAMELERAIAVIGLVFKMPYVPDDSARTAFDVLHFTMSDNAFSFSTVMAKECALVASFLCL